MLQKFIEQVKISDLEAQRLAVIRQLLALEFITFILVAVASSWVFGSFNFLIVLLLMVPAQFPLAFIVIVYQKLVKPRLRKSTAPEIVSSQKIRSHHTADVLTKIFLATLKWITVYIICWIVLSFFWAKACLSHYYSEAGQAMGLLGGFIIITPGTFIILTLIPVFRYLKKNKHKGWTFRNIVRGGYILMVVLSFSWGIFNFYRNYQAAKKSYELWEQSQTEAIENGKMDEAQ